MHSNKYGNIQHYLESREPFRISRNKPYFPGESERCVEIPFVFSSIGKERKIVDIGTSLADPSYFYGLLSLIEQKRELYACDIVPFNRVHNRFVKFDQSLINSIRFSCQDIRFCSYKTDTFDLVLCVSVLEHLGFDKYLESPHTVFDRPAHDYSSFPALYDCREDEKAIREMIRILHPGGKLILTVPFGSGGVFSTKDSKGYYAMHLEYNENKWNQIKSSMPAGTTVYEHYYKHDSSLGWQEETNPVNFSKYMPGNEYKENGVLCAVIVKK